jgi:endonuclease/exonuclease/phosphatase (EEP) superfamily protein YafD
MHAVEAVAADTAHGSCDRATIRLFVANVRQSNRQSAPLMHEISTTDPDLVLLLETDAWWERQLETLHQRYPNVVAQPQDDGYGMFLLSRLPLIEPQVRFLLENYVPSIETGVRLPSGTTIIFHGVHPKPPPLHDTERRDAELLIVGRQVRSESRPAIVAGDLNDVAWSDTTRLFQQISGLLDPRIGRGLYSTYNANWPFLRWPVDHVFFENSFTLMDMRRLGYIGSDHFPLYVELCQRPDAAPRQPQPQPATEDLRRAREQIRQGREDAESPD